jgi:hypothetical protein
MNSYSSNNGSALAIGLVILTAITLVSITALQRSGIQARMVGNSQHKEQAFHAANGELEEIYQFYATQASATAALSAPLQNFEIINDEQVFGKVVPGHTSTYNNYIQSSTTSDDQHSDYDRPARLDVDSNIQHTGLRSTLVDGFSVGTFVEYGFVVTAKSSEPSFGVAPGKTLSSQVIGIKYIAPAG